ncbi:MAG TPA: hypothetical protein VFN67_26180 [Polyangiales bacterium]|nr:hypothetical protein [Polyangiales bacterium]
MSANKSVLKVLVFALSLGACGSGDGNKPGSEPSASEKASENAAGEDTARVMSSASAGAQAQPMKSPGNAAAGSSNMKPASSGGTMAQASSAGASGSPGNTAAAAGSAGDPVHAGAGGSAGTGAAGSAASGTSMCDRACLTGFNDAYLAALTAHDATKLETSATVRFTENGKPLQLTEGLWAVAKELGSYRQDMAEVPAGQTAGFVSLTDDRGAVLLAFRLKVVNMEVTEIETTVCRTGEATFFSPDALMHNKLYDEEIPADARMDREALTKIVDSYFAGIESGDGSGIPFADTARRNENGTTTGMGTGLKNVAMFSYIDKIERRYVLVDVERGNVLPWVLFQIPMGLTGSRTLHLAELFKVDGGKIMDVQAIMVNQPLGTPGGWE